MSKPALQEKKETQGLYDRIADVQHMAMKLNGYRASVANFLKSLNLNIGADSVVLDAGSGTGIVSLAFHDAGLLPRKSVALDLSLNSLGIARDEFNSDPKYADNIDEVQGNILCLPFSDATFDLVLMCGVLEYTPLDDGLRETARVLKKGSPLVLIPVKQSIVGTVLELLYNFKTHKKSKVRAAAEKYFKIVGNYEFPVTEPIAWSKTIFLLEKK